MLTSQYLKHWFTSCCDELLSPMCSLCHTPTSTHSYLCIECLSQIEFIAGSLCKQCGRPTHHDHHTNERCPKCIISPPLFDTLRSAVLYASQAKKLVLNFKYHDHPHLSKLLARWMSLLCHDIFVEAEVLIPIPLHPFRLLKRNYNQTYLLAKDLGKLYPHLTIKTDILRRTHYTKPQTSLSKNERLKNQSKAFDVNPKKARLISHKSLVLVDDVYTTGATIQAAIKALQPYRPTSIRVATFGRT